MCGINVVGGGGGLLFVCNRVCMGICVCKCMCAHTFGKEENVWKTHLVMLNVLTNGNFIHLLTLTVSTRCPSRTNTSVF